MFILPIFLDLIKLTIFLKNINLYIGEILICGFHLLSINFKSSNKYTELIKGEFTYFRNPKKKK